MAWKQIVLVAVGGALGAVARLGVTALLPRAEFPWATLAVNLAGSFLVGAFFLSDGAAGTARSLAAVGFLGALTTLSTYSGETIDLWRSGRTWLAATNMAANGLGGPLMALSGWRIASLWP